MMLGSLLQATAYTRAHLLVARIVAGFGLGAVNSTVPVFQAEFAPKATRGLCMSTPLSILLSPTIRFLPSPCLHIS
jgi:MFS family permease